MYINKISIKTSKYIKEHCSKKKSIKNCNKNHCREILCEAFSLSMSMIFSSCSSLRNFGPPRQIGISQLRIRCTRRRNKKINDGETTFEP